MFQTLTGVLVLHYLQSISPSLAVGAELAYQRGGGVPGGQVGILSLAGRYINGNSTISGSISTYLYITLDDTHLVIFST